MKRILLSALVFSALSVSATENDFRRVHIKKGETTPMLMVLNDNVFISKERASDYLSKTLRLKPYESLVVFKEKSDDLGYTHVYYRQHVNGIPVMGAEYAAHIKNGRVEKYTGHYFDNITPENVAITKQTALDKALQYFGASHYMWEDAKEEAMLKAVTKGENATYYPTPELIYFNKNLSLNNPEFELSYKIELYSKVPLRKEEVYVNASTGRIAGTIQKLHDVSVPATGRSKFSDTVSFVSEQVAADTFILRDYTRSGGVITYNMQEGTDHSAAIDFYDSDNFWDNWNSDLDEVAIDAHWGATQTYEFYAQKLGRDSYNGNGAPLLSYVHYGVNYNNAFWDGTRMTYGDGSGNPFLSIDIVGHEFTHGVTQYASGLIYQNESGALNESFSDIFGNAIEYFADPNRASWLMGEQSFNSLRNMEDPWSFNNPKTYKGANYYEGSADNGGVHTNSGVQNYWYYLLVEGGSGVNEFGNSYSITKMGWDTATQIAYRNLEFYLTATSNHYDAAIYSVESANDFYGECSPESDNVHNAWYAVGVLEQIYEEVTTDFILNYSYVCTLPATIAFKNLTTGANTYSWNFGGVTTSDEKDPVVTFANEGIYDIVLTSSIASTCLTDTDQKIKTLNLKAIGSPVTAACIPTVKYPSKSIGIAGVLLNTLEFYSAIDDADYNDYTCESNTILNINNSYELTVLTNPSTKENVRVWIDFNSNGQFTDDELVLTSDDVYREHKATLSFSSNPALYMPLRMRIASDVFVNKSFDACEGVRNGKIEDYSVVLTDDDNAPLMEATLGIKDMETTSFSIYPNPAKDRIFIANVGASKIEHIKIINLLGEQIIYIRNTDNSMDVSGLSKGAYMLQIFTDEGVHTQKMLIE